MLGEYSVMAGGEAIVASVGPTFSGTFSSTPLEVETFLHEASPAGMLRKKVSERMRADEIPEIHFQLNDPHGGLGGFGGSTAEFAFWYALYMEIGIFEKSSAWENPYEVYRGLHKNSLIQPSGVDLIAQWLGGVVAFDPSSLQIQDLSSYFHWDDVMVFSGTHQEKRKVPTWKHLIDLKERGVLAPNTSLLNDLDTLTQEGKLGIQNREPLRLGRALTEYGETLRGVGLECDGSHNDRKAFNQLEGVLGSKGCGAMLSDVVIVLMDSQADDSARKQVQDVAAQRNLVWVQKAMIKQEKGLYEIS